MRDSTKVIIGFGSIWGLFAFGSMLFSSFTIGANDSAPEVVAILLYGLTILPSCILAIWFMRYAALWLMLLSPITACGFVYQVIHSRKPAGNTWTVAGGLAEALAVAVIPGAIGALYSDAGASRPRFGGVISENPLVFSVRRIRPSLRLTAFVFRWSSVKPAMRVPTD